jgi:hypothetical protein
MVASLSSRLAHGLAQRHGVTCPVSLIVHGDGTVAGCTENHERDGCRRRDEQHDGSPVCRIEWLWLRLLRRPQLTGARLTSVNSRAGRCVCVKKRGANVRASREGITK